ncbi:MAG: BamA/TamA family outer membrane protein [Cyanobacteria bacterium P01_H01_bin.119]
MTISAAWSICDRAQGQTLDDAVTVAVSTAKPAPVGSLNSAPGQAVSPLNQAIETASASPSPSTNAVLEELLTPAAVIADSVVSDNSLSTGAESAVKSPVPSSNNPVEARESAPMVLASVPSPSNLAEDSAAPSSHTAGLETATTPAPNVSAHSLGATLSLTDIVAGETGSAQLSQATEDPADGNDASPEAESETDALPNEDEAPETEFPDNEDEAETESPDDVENETDAPPEADEVPELEFPDNEDDAETESPDDVESETDAPPEADEGEDAETESPADEDDAEIEPPADDPADDQPAAEVRVLVAEVEVIAVEGATLTPELEDEVYSAIGTRPGRDTTRSQLQSDINSIFETGFFANVQAVPEDTPLGVRVTFRVQPNPILREVVISNSALTEAGTEDVDAVVEEIFEPQYGEIINLIDFQNGILALNQWYQDNGYILAEVTAAPRVAADGTVTLIVAEGVISDINVQFLNQEGSPVDDEGNPVGGVTRDFIITREFMSQPGDVFNQADIQQDLQRVFGLGIFDDVRLSLERVSNRQVNVIVNVIERSTGSVAAGLGFNFTGDLFGTLSYRQDNFGGNNQKFSAETQLSFRDILFDISFTDPWIAGDPNRTSYTVNAFARRTVSLVFDNGPVEVVLPNGDDVRINRFGGGVTFARPLGGGWTGSLGTQVQRVSTRDGGGAIATADALGNPLSFSGIGQDDLWTVQFGLVNDQRDDPLNPTRGSVLRLSTDQSIPLGLGNILLNRVQASYSYYIPLSLINFSDGPQALALNIQAGTVLGDLPPYEAFALGGTNSVRGYDEGALASGRSYLQASAEYRFPIFSFIGGALFADIGTDLGSGFSVLGAPGPTRGKQGSGFGYGAGVRVQTPLGPIRIDYGFNDSGDGRLHFGIGERF